MFGGLTSIQKTSFFIIFLYNATDCDTKCGIISKVHSGESKKSDREPYSEKSVIIIACVFSPEIRSFLTKKASITFGEIPSFERRMVNSISKISSCASSLSAVIGSRLILYAYLLSGVLYTELYEPIVINSNSGGGAGVKDILFTNDIPRTVSKGFVI